MRSQPTYSRSMCFRRGAALLCCLLALFMLFSACTIQAKQPAATAGTTGQPMPGGAPSADLPQSSMLFWQVTDPETGGMLYLMGSIHTADDSIYPLPQVVTEAYQHADSLAVEADILALENDPAALAEAAALMVYTDGTTIRDHLPADLYQAAKKRLSDAGAYNAAYEWMKPGMWSSALDNLALDAAGLDSDKGVDLYFLKQAARTGKRIIEIESVMAQYEMLAGFSDETWAMLMQPAVDDPAGQAEEAKKMYSLWKSGDFDAFSAYVAEEPEGLSQKEQQLYAAYQREMIDDRNVGMAQKAIELLKSGETCFFIVGAAHMAGETGVVSALQNAGFTVTQR